MAVTNAQSYESSIISTLAATDPQMNTGLGTPVRKIISAVAQELANYGVDANVTSTLYSLESVSGDELDYLVGQFGFTRQMARFARGVVTIRRDDGDSYLQIPYGTRFMKPATATSPSITFLTTSYQELAVGVLSAEVAVIASVQGSIGNVPANTITYTVTSTGFMSVTNLDPTTGGRDAETDEQLRRRFLDTVFRNVSGTSDQMYGLALANERVNRVNLIGLESRYSETVQVSIVDGHAVANVSEEQWEMDVKRALDPQRRYWVKIPGTVDTMLSHGQFTVSQDGRSIELTPVDEEEVIGPIAPGATFSLPYTNVVLVSVTSGGSEVPAASYEFDAVAGTITVDDEVVISGAVSWTVAYTRHLLEAGDFIVIEFDYLSKHNRGGLKTVDLFIDALTSQQVTDIQYVDFTKVITSDNRSWWERPDGTNPALGGLYIPLSYQPLNASSGHINMGSSIVLREGIHFLPLYDVTSTAGSARGIDAVELLGAVSGDVFVFSDGSLAGVPDGTPLSAPYYQDDAVSQVQELIDAQRVVTMDVLVHEAVHRRFRVCLTLMYSVFPLDSVKQSVETALIGWSDTLPFGRTIQFSDIETVAANQPGVDNVRVAIESDAGSSGLYGLIELERDGETVVNRFDGDFRMAQNEVFEIVDFVFYAKSQQSWGA